MKNLLLAFTTILLFATAGASWLALRDIVLAGPKYQLVRWTVEEIEILNKVYSELGKHQKVPLASYPYQLEKTPEGYVIRFQSTDFLRLRDSFLLGEDMYDGCAFYYFDQDFRFEEVQHCG